MVTGPVPPPRDGSRQQAVWIWNVYPRVSSHPNVAAGVTMYEEDARVYVETVLAADDVNTAWGVVVGPGGRTDMCRRNGKGGYHWRPAGEQ